MCNYGDMSWSPSVSLCWGLILKAPPHRIHAFVFVLKHAVKLTSDSNCKLSFTYLICVCLSADLQAGSPRLRSRSLFCDLSVAFDI